MERKTIGSFIAALRKANGMTQKELADRLLVSDKAVSRWERDECAPDISLIPVIAELFGVTSDELLMGERKSSPSAPSEYTSAKTEKQQDRLLKAATLRHKNSTLISIGLTSAGLIAGLLINFGFLRAYIGFFAACVFLIAAVITELISHSRTLSSLDTDELDAGKLSAARLRIVKYTLLGCCAAAVVLAFLLPLMFVGDAFCGITFITLVKIGVPLAIGAALIGVIVSFIIRSRIAGAYSELDRAKHKLLVKVAIPALAFAIIIFAVSLIAGAATLLLLLLFILDMAIAFTVYKVKVKKLKA